MKNNDIRGFIESLQDIRNTTDFISNFEQQFGEDRLQQLLDESRSLRIIISSRRHSTEDKKEILGYLIEKGLDINCLRPETQSNEALFYCASHLDLDLAEWLAATHNATIDAELFYEMINHNAALKTPADRDSLKQWAEKFCKKYENQLSYESTPKDAVTPASLSTPQPDPHPDKCRSPSNSSSESLSRIGIV